MSERLRILVIQTCDDDGPAWLERWLRKGRIPRVLLNVDAGLQVPESAEAWDAIAMLGGTMSVNDKRPFLRRAEMLMRDAIARGRPIVGHCLGGQMLARALGATVTDNLQPEIGWSRIEAAHPSAADWFGQGQAWPVFQWHYQTFALPDGAVRLAGNAACANQAFSFGPHLATQFHAEVDAEKLARWHLEAPAEAAERGPQPGVQDEAAMRRDTERWLADSQRVADSIYTRWLALAAARSDR